MMRAGGLLLAACLGAAQAATVSGRVTRPDGSPLRDAVVFLSGPRGGTPPRRHPVLDQRRRTFIPHVMAVLQGTTVDFPNSDHVFHNVFSVRDGKRFDLGLYPAGTRREVRFDKTGLVRIFCNIHSDMSAYIWVLENPYYAVTDRSGRYRIDDAPPGPVRLRAWHERCGDTEEPVIVPPAGSLRRDFTLALR